MRSALIADANPAFIERVALVLGESGLEVFTATSSAGAVRLATEPGLAVALVDLGMPDVSGRPVLEAILRAAPDLRVIAMSRAPGPDAVIDALARGAVDHVTRPVSVAELAARMRSHARSTAQAA